MSDLFTDEPLPEEDLFTDEPAPAPKSVGGFASNAVEDVKGIASGLGGFAKKAVTQNPIQTGMEAVTAIPEGIWGEVKRLGGKDLMQGNFKEAGSKFIEGAYEKPVTTALDILPAVAGVKKLAGMRGAAPVAEAAGVADDVARQAPSMVDDVVRQAPEAPSPLNLGDEAADILKAQPKPPLPEAAPSQSSFAGIKEKLPNSVKGPLDEVESFVNEKYGKMASNPKWNETLGDMAIRKAQAMRIQEIGFTPGQVRKLIEKKGEDWVRSMADYAEEKGVTKPVVGYQIGKQIEKLEKNSERMIGGIRDIASKRGAVHNPDHLINQIRAKLDDKYLKGGSASSEKGNYLKALQDIKNGGSSADDVARTATGINRYGTKNQMVQKKGALSDVANEVSRINNELIAKHLSPQEFAAYQEALKEFGAAQVFKRGRSFSASRELAGRAGVGGFWRNLKQGTMDIGGGKVMEKFYDSFGRRLKTNPKTASSIGDLTGDALQELLSALDETIDELGSQAK